MTRTAKPTSRFGGRRTVLTSFFEAAITIQASSHFHSGRPAISRCQELLNKVGVIYMPIAKRFMEAIQFALLCAAMIASSSNAVEAASPGALDPSFGVGGKVTTLQGPNGVNDIAAQPDGKIVVVGSCTREATLDFCVHRYDSNGSIDRTFGIDGSVLTDFTNQNDIAFGVAIQPDGKIVVAGTIFNAAGTEISAFARYLPNGSVDASFDSDGKATFDTPAADEVVGDVAIQGDGRIVAVGVAGIDFLIIRLNVNVSPDVTFSGDGFATTSIGGRAQASAVVIQPDGRIVAAGSLFVG